MSSPLPQLTASIYFNGKYSKEESFLNCQTFIVSIELKEERFLTDAFNFLQNQASDEKLYC